MNVWLEDASGAVIPGSVKNTSNSKLISRKGLKDMPVLNVNYNSYYINSLNALYAFSPWDTDLDPENHPAINAKKEVIQNITIDYTTDPDGIGDTKVVESGDYNGDGIVDDTDKKLTPDHYVSFVKLRVKRLLGNLTVIGANLESTEQFFELTDDIYTGFTPGGSVIFKDCPYLMNLNGLRDWTYVGGDLIFENCPKVNTQWGETNCLSQIKEVKGSLMLVGVQTYMFGVTFHSLKKVGGNFHIANCNGNFWNFDTMTLEEIGGDLIIDRNANFNSLDGFENIRSIGGKVFITGNGFNPQTGQGGVLNNGGRLGFELVQRWINSGIVAKEDVYCTDVNGNQVIFN